MPTIELTDDEVLLVRASMERERDEAIRLLKFLGRDIFRPGVSVVLVAAWGVLSKLEAANADD
jgi:hypothetical protein